MMTNDSFLNIYKGAIPLAWIEDVVRDATGLLRDVGGRRFGFFSDECEGQVYRYGSLRLTKGIALPSSLRRILDFVNAWFASDYNCVLVNQYTDGSKYISRHSDSRNHPENGVLILSHGATRNFRVFNRVSGRKQMDIPLIHGEMLHMGGRFQEEFTHDIEPTRSTASAIRTSICFHKFQNLGLYSE
jgi:alkylated DNA repair dioxygenase AlkB